jgi:hypothetical protein
MTHVDFVIGFVLMLSTIFLIIYFVSSSISNNVNQMRTNEIRESSITLEKYLFGINSDGSLIESVNELQATLTETNGTSHSEEITLSIKTQADKVKVYDNLWSEIASSSSQLPSETLLYFTLDFNPNEKKAVKIIYFGNGAGDIEASANNISVRVLSEKKINMVTQERCSDLQGVSYDNFRSTFDFRRQFRLDSEACSYGSNPPLTTSIIVRNVPIIFEDSDGLLKTGLARLSVW